MSAELGDKIWPRKRGTWQPDPGHFRPRHQIGEKGDEDNADTSPRNLRPVVWCRCDVRLDLLQSKGTS